MSDLSVNFLLFKGEKYVSKSLNKIRPQSPMEKLSRYLWSTLLFVYSPLTKNSAVDSLCQFDSQQVVNICNIGNITSRVAMAIYLLMLPRGETV